MKRNCLYCGKLIHVRDLYQEPACKEPSARCKRLREDAEAKFAERQRKDALSTVRTAARSEQSERYGPDLRNDDGDVIAVEDLGSPDVHVKVSEIEEQEGTESKVRVEGAVCEISTADEVEEIADTERAEAETASLELDKEKTNDESEDEAEEESEVESEEIVEETAPLILPEPKRPEPGDIGPDKKKKSRFSTPAFPVVPSADPSAPYGLDRNGSPIRAMRTDREIHTSLLESRNLLYTPCRHQNDPAHCAICKGERGEPLPQKKADPVAAPLPAPRDDSDMFSARDKILYDRRAADLKERRRRLLAGWEVRRQKLTKERDELFEKKWTQDPSELNEEALLAADLKLSQEAGKATQAIAAIADQITKLSLVSLRKELDISQTTIVEWLDRDGILHDSWRETRFNTRTVKREVKPAEKPARETSSDEDLASPEQIQNLKRCSRNARKDNPSWSDKRVRQYRYEIKKQIRDVSALLKGQARNPKRQPPSAPGPQYETVVENIPETEHEVTCFGEDIFEQETVTGYRDMIAFRGPQTHKFDGFENDVIRRACQVGVFKPSARAVRRFPELLIRVQADNSGGADTDNSFDHAQQDKAILKGGIGGMQFIGAGWECNVRTGRMRRRTTNNFSGMRNLGGPAGKGSGPDDGSFGDSFGDVDMPADSEGDES
jgi:hypothetical protein